MKNRAETILEVVIASVIIAICAIAVSATFVWAKRTNVATQRQIQAIDFAKDTLEEILLDVNDNNYDTLTVGVHADKDLPTCDLKTLFTGERKYTITAITEGHEVAVTVSWKEADEPNRRQETLYGILLSPPQT